MANLLEIPESRMFSLPFEKDTFLLTLITLNSHSNFNHSEVPRSAYEMRKISFINEILTLGIRFYFEKEERVYLKVTSNHLLVSCSVDTDSSYLSRYAYFAIYSLISIYERISFNKYYWPDFFNKKNGTSKYLEIINDREGLDVFLKPEYASFVRPNQILVFPKIGFESTRPVMVMRSKESLAVQRTNGVGFCIACTDSPYYHFNHFPFLIPFCGTLTKDSKSIKSFKKFLNSPKDFESLELSSIQIKLCETSLGMRELAAISRIDDKLSFEERMPIFRENARRFFHLFYLWKKAIDSLPFQSNMYYYTSWGLRDMKKRPQKRRMVKCEIAYEAPKICFIWKDKVDYFELEYRFRINNKLMIPSEDNTLFFVNERDNPLKFYLFDSASDAEISAFFAITKFKMLILKEHYEGKFQHYIEQLAKSYEFIKK